MTTDAVARAFDPFFTTHPLEGRVPGWACRWSMFVRQYGGQARIHAQRGEGTTVCLCLPRHADQAEASDLVPHLADPHLEGPIPGSLPNMSVADLPVSSGRPGVACDAGPAGLANRNVPAMAGHVRPRHPPRQGQRHLRAGIWHAMTLCRGRWQDHQYEGYEQPCVPSPEECGRASKHPALASCPSGCRVGRPRASGQHHSVHGHASRRSGRCIDLGQSVWIAASRPASCGS